VIEFTSIKKEILNNINIYIKEIYLNCIEIKLFEDLEKINKLCE